MLTILLNSNNSIEAEFNRLKLVLLARIVQKFPPHCIMATLFNSKTKNLATESKVFKARKVCFEFFNTEILFKKSCSSYNFYVVSDIP
jgi:hypothetical protein